MNQENLQADMISLFQETAEYAKKFHKKTYASDMDILLNRHGALLGRIREAFEVSDEALAKTASVIPDYAAEQLAAVPSKRKRDLACLDFNMNMVSFFVPLLGEISSVKTKEFTEKMIDRISSLSDQQRLRLLRSQNSNSVHPASYWGTYLSETDSTPYLCDPLSSHRLLRLVGQ